MSQDQDCAAVALTVLKLGFASLLRALEILPQAPELQQAMGAAACSPD